ncbi:alpha/beta hydrolase fold domain-containing protein [Tomitella biformata]|uniref:alpha/beta hydrolase fold domain-containing protein n=2 Tax=Tomitella biformata TaxID=630403 RepID=UPI001F3AEC02|nr:alpha/beta hydrolase fold domain-containing protein [Tomitella biformata]
MTSWQGMPVHTLSPRGAGGGAAGGGKRMMFLHGGGYTTPIHSAHWKLAAKIAVQNNLTVIVPTFALAPEGNVQDGLARLLGLYQDLIRDGSPVDYLAGDSSGGGFAYAFSQRIRDEGLALPRRVFLFSPWLDITLENPDIEALARKEPILDVPTLRRFGLKWAGGDDPKSSSVSPIFGDLTGLPPVHIFIGTKDIFLADCRALVRKAREVNADVWFYEYFGAFHVFMWLDWLPESRHVFREIRKITRQD